MARKKRKTKSKNKKQISEDVSRTHTKGVEDNSPGLQIKWRGDKGDIGADCVF